MIGLITVQLCILSKKINNIFLKWASDEVRKKYKKFKNERNYGEKEWKNSRKNYHILPKI